MTNQEQPNPRKARKYKDGLTMLGEWYYDMCNLIGVSGSEIARRAGIKRDVISRGTRDVEGAQTAPLNRAQVFSLRDQIKAEMQRKGLQVEVDWETYFLNAAGFASEAQIEVADLAFERFQRAHTKDQSDPSHKRQHP